MNEYESIYFFEALKIKASVELANKIMSQSHNTLPEINNGGIIGPERKYEDHFKGNSNRDEFISPSLRTDLPE